MSTEKSNRSKGFSTKNISYPTIADVSIKHFFDGLFYSLDLIEMLNDQQHLAQLKIPTST